MKQGGIFYWSKSRILLLSAIGFILGTLLASFISKDLVSLDFYWFAFSLGFFIFLILTKNHRVLRIIALLGLFLFLGIWRYSISLPENTADKIWFYNGQTATVEGVVVAEPDVRDKNIKYKVEIKKFLPRADPSNWAGRQPLAEKINKEYLVEGLLLVTTELYPQYRYGDGLRLTCELKAPEAFDGFAYDKYLARYQIHSVCYYPQVEKLAPGQGNAVLAFLYQTKDKARQSINQGLSEPVTSLAKAVTLGDKRGIPVDIRETFSRTGISHLVAISGMHISILGALLMIILIALGLSRHQAFYAVLLFLIIYITLIGFPMSAVRAGIMGALVLIALKYGRLSRLTNSLVLTAAIIMLFNPLVLRNDIGFQLSFLAVMGIGLGFGVIKQLLESWRIYPERNIIKRALDILIVTIAAQLFTWPILVINFSTLSLIAPLTNLLVLWTLPIILISTMLAIILTLVLPSGAVIWFLISNILFNYILFISEYLEKIPVSYVQIDYIWPVWWLLYYLLLILGLAWSKKKRKI